MWTQVKRLKPGRFQPHVVLLKDRTSIRLYIPAHLRHQIGDPTYIDIYTSPGAGQILIQPAFKKGPDTRKLSCGSVRLAYKVWGVVMKKLMHGRKMVCVWHQLDRGNLRVDLTHEIKEKKEATRRLKE